MEGVCWNILDLLYTALSTPLDSDTEVKHNTLRKRWGYLRNLRKRWWHDVLYWVM